MSNYLRRSMGAHLLWDSAGVLDPAPSPFPPLKVPPLAEVVICETVQPFPAWMLRKLAARKAIRGYFRGLQPIDHNWVLARYTSEKESVTWMSITPMELESQSHHLVAARGRVCVGGMGMGVLAWNLCQKGSVSEVVVVEKDPAIVKLVEYQAKALSWENWDKVQVVFGDILNPDLKMSGFDVALIDIWQGLGDMSLRPDMLRIARSIGAKEYGAWGMELDFISWCKEQGIEPGNVQGRHYPEYAKALGIPLIMSTNRRMAQYAMRAALNYALEYLNPSV